MGVIHDCRFLALQNGWVMEICCTMMGMRLTYCTVPLEIVERVNLMFFFHNKEKIKGCPISIVPFNYRWTWICSPSTSGWTFSLFPASFNEPTKILKHLRVWSVLFLLLFGHAVWHGKIFVHQAGMEPVLSALEAWCLNHWTSRQVPKSLKYLKITFSSWTAFPWPGPSVLYIH